MLLGPAAAAAAAVGVVEWRAVIKQLVLMLTEKPCRVCS
jgi:hypothetical protein